MSDVIETGAKRRIDSLARPRSQSIGKRRKIDKTKDEVKLEQRDDEASKKAAPVPAASAPAGKTEPSRPGREGDDEVKLSRFKGRTDDEVELGRFTGKTRDDTEPKPGATPRPTPKGEVVGPKRRRVQSDEDKAKRRRSGGEMEIASTRDISDDAEPSRPRQKKRSRSRARGDRSWLLPAALALFSILLVLLTAATFLLMPRYNILGEPLIADPAFDDGLASWSQEGLISTDPDVPAEVVLESISASSRTYLVRDIALPPDDTLLILEARVRGEDVVLGPNIWDSARIYLAQIGTDGKPNWKVNHNLFNISGTTDIRNYRQAFSMPSEVEIARLAIELKNATGTLTVSRLELIVAEYKTSFMIAVGSLLAAWSAVVLFTTFKTFSGIESKRIRAWLGVFGALSVIGLMLPGGTHDTSAEGVAGWLGITDVGVDTIGHAVIFTALAFLVRLGRPADPLWLHVGVWCLIAIASEVLQLFTVGRDPSLEDLWVDGFGIVLGLALAEIVNRVQRFRSA